MPIELRRARIDEAKDLTELSMRSKRSNGYDDVFMAACQEELTVTPEKMTAGEYWLAEDDGLLGCVCLLADVAVSSGEVHAFFVDPIHQRRGVGRLLWQCLVEQAKIKGLTRLHLDADPEAVPFYQAMGFSIAGQTPSGSVPGRTLPKMEIVLK